MHYKFCVCDSPVFLINLYITIHKNISRTWFFCFCFSLSVMFLRLLHILGCKCSSFIFTARYYYLHNLLIFPTYNLVNKNLSSYSTCILLIFHISSSVKCLCMPSESSVIVWLLFLSIVNLWNFYNKCWIIILCHLYNNESINSWHLFLFI